MEPGDIIPLTRWPAWLGAAALLIASWIGIAALSLQVRAGTEVVAVAFPPWWGARRAVLAAASAHASIVRMTAVPTLLVVRPDRDGGLNRLYKAGAWLTVDPKAVAACIGADDELGIGDDLRR
ncbi:hypothetical protein MTX26_03255 [Bradyrhizobium sp. ISRA443]|uniref:hypothetical protein n=1 Tax=unclassified Bradyrhizobium TaxID=2631580 RepID=UPI002479C128|nr:MULTISPECIES: hypothetical protein [unclassified Bradyrhizobium]WGR99896.1 hypothetical protein MTX23_03255 [Bradyrhizobium sp. ISRA436]WGS06786.1 hypothetical protein MTX18_03255 [Bradyrhizobium sp. ISRA437]WGS13669.1 hypothetical protein MTX26_03255 [Bradyrhizobium sp. ISRA443]